MIELNARLNNVLFTRLILLTNPFQAKARYPIKRQTANRQAESFCQTDQPQPLDTGEHQACLATNLVAHLKGDRLLMQPRYLRLSPLDRRLCVLTFRTVCHFGRILTLFAILVQFAFCFNRLYLTDKILLKDPFKHIQTRRRARDRDFYSSGSRTDYV